MIPIFPKFKEISQNDREVILVHTKNFLPYSDYNFNSLWAWNTAGDMEFSDLNGNLVVSMPDYVTGERILSYIGINEPKATVAELLAYARKEGVKTGLTLVPEVSVAELPSDNLIIEEDKDNNDYIYSTEALSELKGKTFKVKRHLANRFKKEHPEAQFITSSVSAKESEIQILEVLSGWVDKKTSTEETKLENEAIKRTLMLAKLDKNDLILSGVYIEDKLVAFSIDEILANNFAISHFYKAKNNYVGVSEYLNLETAAFLFSKGIELWNWEQDLGIEGLKKSKLSYRPTQMLKKYKIRKI